MEYPLFRLGEEVEYGVAAYLAPACMHGSELAPSHFECGVEYVENQDYTHHSNQVRASWKRRAKQHTPGLVGSIAFMFPSTQGRACTKRTKHIELSVWQEEQHARADATSRSARASVP